MTTDTTRREAVAWRMFYHDAWDVTTIPGTAEHWRSRGYNVEPLVVASEHGAVPVVKPLEWRKPTDHPQDDDEALWVAHGIGGRYSISKRQVLHLGGQGHLLWWPHDEFTFAEFRTVVEAKAAAQADYETRIRSALVASPPAPAVADRAAIIEECARVADEEARRNYEVMETLTASFERDLRAEYRDRQRVAKEIARAIRALAVEPRGGRHGS